MGHKRVLTVGAIMVAAAISAPTAAMLAPGGAQSDAPPEPPLIEITEPLDSSVPPSMAILDPVSPAPTITVSGRPSRRLDPARDPVATPPPEQTPPQDPVDQPPPPATPPDPADPTDNPPQPQPPASQPAEESTRPAPPTFSPDEPDPADTVVLPPPSFPDDDDPADH
jgi:hypothetical protein